MIKHKKKLFSEIKLALIIIIAKNIHTKKLKISNEFFSILIKVYMQSNKKKLIIKLKNIARILIIISFVIVYS